MPGERDPTKRPTLDEIMQQRHPDWEQMPEARRGQLLVEWFQELLETEEGERIRAELRQNEEESYPTNSISKEDLIWARPDLDEEIKALSDDQMWDIADRVGEIIKDDYWAAVHEVLGRAFDRDEEDGDDDDEPSE